MIIDSFDPDSEAIVSPKAFFGEQRKFMPRCVLRRRFAFKGIISK